MQVSGERSVVVEIALDILKFPLWWYTSGLLLMLNWCGRTLKGYAQFMGIGVWVKNIFVPMFGQHDWQSRMISIFMRIIQIIARSMALVFIAIGIVLVFGMYLAAPALIIGLALWNFLGSLTYGTGV